MTRFALALLACLLIAAPAASAQSFDEGECRASGAPRPFCVGVAKLGERASAECRRLGIADDATCWSRVGRRVVRAEVERFAASRTAAVLDFQQHLGDDVPFADAPWLGTHNAFNSPDEQPTLSHTDSNQQLGLTEQLQLGMRMLELDAHWLPSARAGGAFAAVLCHGTGAVGCSTERLLRERLAESVAPWLAAHPGEVLLLYLEDQIGAAGYETAAADVRSTLGAYLYEPQGGGCRDLPLSLTRDDVLAAGKQVVVVGSCGSGPWQGVSHAWPGSVRIERRNFGFTCADVDPVLSPQRIYRYYEDSTWVGSLTGGDDGLTPAALREMLRCGVDLPGFDQLLPGDGRLEAAVWSWADESPIEPSCAVQRPDGRWAVAGCEEEHRVACRSADGWELSAAPVRRADAAAACARPSAPRTARENAALRAAAGAAPVWLVL